MRAKGVWSAAIVLAVGLISGVASTKNDAVDKAAPFTHALPPVRIGVALGAAHAAGVAASGTYRRRLAVGMIADVSILVGSGFNRIFRACASRHLIVDQSSVGESQAVTSALSEA
jgi:hypothetical protein